MNDGHPIRYFLHDKKKSDVLSETDSTLLPLPGLKALRDETRNGTRDVNRFGEDFYAEEYKEPNGVLITPIPFGKKIARTSPPANELDFYEVNDSLSLAYEKANPPEFSDLLRKDHLTGYRLPVDGFPDEIQIPIARSPHAAGSLSKSYVFKMPDDGDEWAASTEEKVAAKHQILFDLGTEVFNSFIDDEIDLNEKRRVAIAAQVVLWNYRIGPLETNFLFERLNRSVFTAESVRDILFCLIDGPNMPTKENQDPQKKT